MKAKIICVVLAVLLVGLVLPGCVSKAELDECKALVAEKTAQIEDLEAQSANQTAEITRLKEENVELQKEIKKSKTAKIEISYSPDPIPCTNGVWRYRVTLKEVNGVGVHINTIIADRCNNYHKDNDTHETYHCFRHILNRLWIEEHHGTNYFLAYDSWGWQASTDVSSLVCVVCTVIGVDDNGHEIIAIGSAKGEST